MKVKSTVMAVAFGFFGFALGAQDAMAAMIRANAHAAMYEHMDDSGEAGARLGTAVHNALFPSRPLPDSDGDVINNTSQNLGAGQSLGEDQHNDATPDGDDENDDN